jgi:hypothetical protein
MTEEQWREIIADKFELIKEMIDHLESDLKKESGKDALAYINPLSTIIFEAAMDLKRQKNKRIDNGEAILKQII